MVVCEYFVENYVDLHITREMSLFKWCFELAKITGVSPHKLLYNLSSDIKAGEKQRRYIDPMFATGTGQIISALKGNKRQIQSDHLMIAVRHNIILIFLQNY